MPIRIQADLPAIEVLESENIFVMTHERANLQDIRPLKIAILNLMPTKIETETQLLRLLGNTPLQVDVELLHPATHVSKNTSSYHLNTFYKTFADVKDQKFDGLIITGAPVEKLPFEEVDYWDEMCQIMEWSKEQRLLGAAHLLGRPGGPVLPLRHSQVPPAGKTQRHLQPHGLKPLPPPDAGL